MAIASDGPLGLRQGSGPTGQGYRAARMIGDMCITDATFDVMRRLLCKRAGAGLQTCIFFANAHFVVQCQNLKDKMRAPGIIVLPDGIAIDTASRILYGRTFRENLNGTDFIPRLLNSMPRNTAVYLLGAKPASVTAAANALREIPTVNVAGTTDGYSMWKDEAATIGAINAASPDILLVALGNPLQEQWILDNRAKLDVPLIFAVGALFDFLSGHQVRAPGWMRSLRCEWLYRMLRDPQRLAGRYSIGIARFARVVARSR